MAFSWTSKARDPRADPKASGQNPAKFKRVFGAWHCIKAHGGCQRGATVSDLWDPFMLKGFIRPPLGLLKRLQALACGLGQPAGCKARADRHPAPLSLTARPKFTREGTFARKGPLMSISRCSIRWILGCSGSFMSGHFLRSPLFMPSPV